MLYGAGTRIENGIDDLWREMLRTATLSERITTRAKR